MYAVFASALALVVLAGCTAPRACAENPELTYVVPAPYSVPDDALRTSSGIRYSGPADPAELDTLVSEVESCLSAQPVPESGYRCFAGLPIDRAQLRFAIATDWHLNCDGTQQVLPIVAPGYDPNKTSTCSAAPSYWRAILEPDGTIASTPSLYAAKDPLVRLVTGVQSIWTIASLATCAAPSLWMDPLGKSTD